MPVVPCAVDTFGWSPLNRRRCAVVFGEPLSLEGLPRGRAGYDQAGRAVEAAIVSALAAGGRRRARRLPRAPGRRRAAERPGAAAGATGEPATLTRVARTTTRNLGRLSEIAQVAVRHGFGYFFESHKLTDLLPGRGSTGR